MNYNIDRKCFGTIRKNQARLNMISQVIFQPSIMFYASLLPDFLRDVVKYFLLLGDID